MIGQVRIANDLCLWLAKLESLVPSLNVYIVLKVKDIYVVYYGWRYRLADVLITDFSVKDIWFRRYPFVEPPSLLKYQV